MASKNNPPGTDGVLAEFKKCGITHVVWLPDGEANFIHDALDQAAGLKFVQVCREGEILAIAAGLIIGGAEPIVMMQNTGFFESGDSTRSIALDLILPIVMLIGYRGWRHGQPMSDSAGQLLEPTLDAWGIPHYLIESEKGFPIISKAHEEAHRTSKPVAVLIGKGREWVP